MQLHTGKLPNWAIFQVLHYEAEILWQWSCKILKIFMVEILCLKYDLEDMLYFLNIFLKRSPPLPLLLNLWLYGKCPIEVNWQKTDKKYFVIIWDTRQTNKMSQTIMDQRYQTGTPHSRGHEATDIWNSYYKLK